MMFQGEKLQRGLVRAARQARYTIEKTGQKTKQIGQQSWSEMEQTVSGRWRRRIILLLVIIHYARLGVTPTWIGLSKPIVVTFFDIAATTVLALLLLLLARFWFRHLTGPINRRVRDFIEKREQADKTGLLDTLLGLQLKTASLFRRLLGERFLDEPLALREKSRRVGLWTLSLRFGLFLALFLIGIAPALGFTWFYNSENWFALVSHWRANRYTVEWREDIVNTVVEYHTNHPGGPRELFDLSPAELDREEFSFVVIGDPGEGDASQFSLHDQLLEVANRPDSLFVLISSDVVYPEGELKDYETNFYQPFKGIQRPIYALPGNHDWYDGLEGFVATFFEESCARAVLENLGSTEGSFDQIERLQKGYNLRTHLQHSPYFILTNDYFALIVVDTGIEKRIDDPQREWLVKELWRAAGKFKMVVLGHPVYVHHEYQGVDKDGDKNEFGELYQLLRVHEVDLVMGGDTHDFEYYEVRHEGGDTIHHYVNGGGGAFLSLGTALGVPARPASEIRSSAYYPRTQAVKDKLANVPLWEALIRELIYLVPAWSDFFSSAFDFNQAPFLQSFVEVSVKREGENTTVRVIPYGAHGRLTWAELDYGGYPPSEDYFPEGEVEFVIQR